MGAIAVTEILNKYTNVRSADKMRKSKNSCLKQYDSFAANLAVLRISDLI